MVEHHSERSVAASADAGDAGPAGERSESPSARVDSAGESATPVGSTAGTPGRSRVRATLAVVPLVAIGLGDLALVLLWGVDPLWGFLIVPPMTFVAAVGWIAFRSGLDRRP